MRKTIYLISCLFLGTFTQAQTELSENKAIAFFDLNTLTNEASFSDLEEACSMAKLKGFKTIFLAPVLEVDESGKTLSHRRTNQNFGRREDYKRSLAKIRKSGTVVIQDLVIGNYSSGLDLLKSYTGAFMEDDKGYMLDTKSKQARRALSMIFRNTAQSAGVDGIRLIFEQEVDPKIINAAISEFRKLLEATESPAILFIEGNGAFRYPEIDYDFSFNDGGSSEASYFEMPSGSLGSDVEYEGLIKQIIRPGKPLFPLSSIDLMNDEHNWDLSRRLIAVAADHPCSKVNSQWMSVPEKKGIEGFYKQQDGNLVLFLKNGSSESQKYKYKNKLVRSNLKTLRSDKTLFMKKKVKGRLELGEWEMFYTKK